MASTGTTSWGSSLSVLELVFLGGSETEKLSTGASGDGVSVGRGDLGGEHLGALLLFVLVGETLHVGLLDGSPLASSPSAASGFFSLSSPHPSRPPFLRSSLL